MVAKNAPCDGQAYQLMIRYNSDKQEELKVEKRAITESDLIRIPLDTSNATAQAEYAVRYGDCCTSLWILDEPGKPTTLDRKMPHSGPLRKWENYTSDRSWMQISFNGVKHKINGFGIRTAQDDYDRDPEKVIVSVPSDSGSFKELITFPLNFGAPNNRTTEFKYLIPETVTDRVKFEFFNPKGAKM